MFRRVILDHWMSIFPLVAFLTAATIYAVMTIKTIRMRPRQINRFASLPFEREQPSPSSHDK